MPRSSSPSMTDLDFILKRHHGLNFDRGAKDKEQVQTPCPPPPAPPQIVGIEDDDDDEIEILEVIEKGGGGGVKTNQPTISPLPPSNRKVNVTAAAVLEEESSTYTPMPPWMNERSPPPPVNMDHDIVMDDEPFEFQGGGSMTSLSRPVAVGPSSTNNGSTSSRIPSPPDVESVLNPEDEEEAFYTSERSNATTDNNTSQAVNNIVRIGFNPASQWSLLSTKHSQPHVDDPNPDKDNSSRKRSYCEKDRGDESTQQPTSNKKCRPVEAGVTSERQKQQVDEIVTREPLADRSRQSGPTQNEKESVQGRGASSSRDSFGHGSNPSHSSCRKTRWDSNSNEEQHTEKRTGPEREAHPQGPESNLENHQQDNSFKQGHEKRQEDNARCGESKDAGNRSGNDSNFRGRGYQNNGHYRDNGKESFGKQMRGGNGSYGRQNNYNKGFGNYTNGNNGGRGRNKSGDFHHHHRPTYDRSIAHGRDTRHESERGAPHQSNPRNSQNHCHSTVNFMSDRNGSTLDRCNPAVTVNNTSTTYNDTRVTFVTSLPVAGDVDHPCRNLQSSQASTPIINNSNDNRPRNDVCSTSTDKSMDKAVEEKRGPRSPENWQKTPSNVTTDKVGNNKRFDVPKVSISGFGNNEAASCASTSTSTENKTYQMKQEKVIQKRTPQEILRLITTCKICKAVSDTREKATRHLKEAHNERICFICYKTFSVKGCVHKQHFITAHTFNDDSEKASCPLCPEKFNYDGMYHHIAKAHLIPIEPVKENKNGKRTSPVFKSNQQRFRRNVPQKYRQCHQRHQQGGNQFRANFKPRHNYSKNHHSKPWRKVSEYSGSMSNSKLSSPELLQNPQSRSDDVEHNLAHAPRNGIKFKIPKKKDN